MDGIARPWRSVKAAVMEGSGIKRRLMLFRVGAVLVMLHPLEADSSSSENMVEGPAQPVPLEAVIDGLESEIARHDDLYYRQGAPVVSDWEYDALVRELEALRAALGESRMDSGAGEATAASAVLSIGDDRTGRFPVAAHTEPMLSLKKAKDEADLQALCQRMAEKLGQPEVPVWIEPKLDGLAVSAVYEEGRLMRVVTRGDGREGEVLTPNFGPATGLPDRLAASAGVEIPRLVELRGEAYIPLETFARLNASREAAGEAPFATPRNLAVGSARLDNPHEAAQRGLRVVIHGWGAWQPASSQPADYGAFRRQMECWGFEGPPEAALCMTVEDISAKLKSLAAERALWNFPADGLVIKVDSTAARARLGSASSAPYWAVAWKFPPPSAVTTLVGITWQTGETGRLTPVAELEPVEIGGRLITRASLHSRASLDQAGYAVGDRVRVVLAGDVIPLLADIVEAGQDAGAP